MAIEFEIIVTAVDKYELTMNGEALKILTRALFNSAEPGAGDIYYNLITSHQRSVQLENDRG
jgi:hypothetical protein